MDKQSEAATLMLMSQLCSLLTCVYTSWSSQNTSGTTNPPKNSSAITCKTPFFIFVLSHTPWSEIQPGNSQESLMGQNLTRFPVSAELVPPTPSSPLEELLGRHSHTAETLDGHAHSQTATKYSHRPHAASAEHPQPDQHHHHHHQFDPSGSNGGGKAHPVALGRSRSGEKG